jgi:hypothetical protein
VVPVQRAGHDGRDASDAVALRRVLDDAVGDLQRQRPARGAADGVELVRVSAVRGRVLSSLGNGLETRKHQ